MAGPYPLACIPGTTKAAARQPSQAARAIAESGLVEFLARFGYMVRGVIYLVPGLYALALALGRRGATLTPQQAIALIGRQPFGRGLLMLVLAGLGGYAVWGIVRALLDPWGRGRSPRGIARRLGYAMSACAYSAFVLITIQLLRGAPTHGGQTQEWAARILSEPFGGWILGVIGLCWLLGAGASEIVWGWTGEFERDLRWERMTQREHAWAVRLGRVGIVARGMIFAVIGCLLLIAALHGNPQRAGGMDEALETIARQPFGRLLLAASALGLVVFGAFSVLCARWMRTRSGSSARRGRASSPTREVRHGQL